MIGSRSTMPRSASVATRPRRRGLVDAEPAAELGDAQLPGLGDQLEGPERAVDRLEVPAVCVSPHATVPRRRDLADATPVPRAVSTRWASLGCGGRTGCVDPPGRVADAVRGSRAVRGPSDDDRGPTRYWRAAEPKAAYDVVIVGGGGHGLATAYYLAANHGITDVCVVEKGWLGGGNIARNTTIIRSNYLWDESAAIYEHSLKLWERLEDDARRSTCSSPSAAC